jgi:hypothetical protein
MKQWKRDDAKIMEFYLLGSSSQVAYTKEFVKIDNKNYIKEAPSVEGDFRNLGFTKYSIYVIKHITFDLFNILNKTINQSWS